MVPQVLDGFVKAIASSRPACTLNFPLPPDLQRMVRMYSPSAKSKYLYTIRVLLVATTICRPSSSAIKGMLFFYDTVADVGHQSAVQIAANGRRIGSICFQRASNALRGHFYLRNASIRPYLDGFCTSLSGICRFMCIAVIKHIPLPIDTLNAAVIGACGIQPVPFPSTLITYIAIGSNGSAINKRPVW